MGAALKYMSMISELNRLELEARNNVEDAEFVVLGATKDVLAVTDDRDTAEELVQNLVDQSDFYDHNQTGRMENSFKVRKAGDEFEVTAVDYAKYVNGRDKESTGSGFVDDAVNITRLDTGEDITQLV
jgi:hypothetical protein